MVNQKDILARLQNGESADAIAQELVNALNAANAQYAEEQAAAKAASDIQARKAEYIQEIGELIKDYILEFHGDSAVAEMIADQEIDAVEIIETVDAAFDQLDAEIRKMKEIESMFKGILGHLEEHDHPHVSTGKIEPNADALSAFLKANGLS